MTKVNFRTNVLLKSIIGKDLITDDNIAVLELVKNSFDAGSNKVNIAFLNLQSNNDQFEDSPTANSSRLIITDTGIGMSEFDLVNKWLNIAYSEKKEKREEYGRILAGNKGVGRFSCDRLGRFLTIYTRRTGENYIKLYIDWKWFEQDGAINLNIQDIELDTTELNELQFEQVADIASFENGTVLEISHLRERWNYNKILSLKRQLERLINPNQSFKSASFEIRISAIQFLEEESRRVDYEKINGPVRNRIFDNLNFKTTSIESKIDSTGDFIVTTLQDRGNEIFNLVEHNRFGLLKDVNIFIYYLNPYSKAYFTKQTGIRSIDFGSIFLFINGFRIPPYGDEGDDWLGMENRKGQGYNRFLGTREVIGRIEIKDENERFKIISSRSGIVSNDTFNQLTKNDSPFGYYYKIFRRLERFVVEGIRWDSTTENEKKIEKEILNNPDWDEANESYLEDSLTRNKRVIEIIRNIIDARKDDIVSLKVNEDFVTNLIDEQTQKVKTELEHIAEQLKSKNLSNQEISEFLERINVSRDELNAFTNIISPYSDNKFESVYLELEQRVLELLQEKARLEERLGAEEELRIKAEKDARIAEEARVHEEEARVKAETELVAEKQKSIYLLATRRTLSEDADGMVHTLKHNSTEIRDGINNLIDDILAQSYTSESLLIHLTALKGYSERSLKLAEIATRSDFKSDIDDRDVDIVKYIIQYIDIYKGTFRKGGLEVEYALNDSSFMKSISVLNLSIVIDNIISNAVKWDANKIRFTFKLLTNNSLSVLISDNGVGLTSKFIGNSENIFELGVGGTPPKVVGGSGIGLYYSRTLLKDMSSSISFIGNGVDLSGACFELKFNKNN
jgi:signal transduction histidine kinase